jgi:predicted nucleotidyltransferase component of viral defense system
MDGHSYPTSLPDIPQWSRENKTTTLEANIRFMEYVVLNCIGSNAITERGMVLKGGNALRFAFQSPRSTKDLDFTVAGDEIPDDPDRLRSLLNDALRFAERRFRVKAQCQHVRRNPPPSPGSTRPTYSISIAYQFETDRYFHNFDERENIATVIPVEVSFNDLVCEICLWTGVNSLKVCSLEDILSEKLRSLLQQKTRHRNRYQDVYDIAKYMRQHAIDRDKIGRFLVQKANVREIDACKSSFDDVIRKMASEDYDVRIHEQAPYNFIPFDDAWQDVLSLVQSLDIPD